MTSLALASPARLFDRISRAFERDTQDQLPAEDPRETREFLNDMIDRNPDAFASEQDVQAMLYCYPGRF